MGRNPGILPGILSSRASDPRLPLLSLFTDHPVGSLCKHTLNYLSIPQGLCTHSLPYRNIIHPLVHLENTLHAVWVEVQITPPFESLLVFVLPVWGRIRLTLCLCDSRYGRIFCMMNLLIFPLFPSRYESSLGQELISQYLGQSAICGIILMMMTINCLVTIRCFSKCFSSQSS